MLSKDPTRGRIILFPNHPQQDVLAHVTFQVNTLAYDLLISIQKMPGRKEESLIFCIHSPSGAVDNFIVRPSAAFLEDTMAKALELYKESFEAVCKGRWDFKVSDWISTLLKEFLPEAQL